MSALENYGWVPGSTTFKPVGPGGANLAEADIIDFAASLATNRTITSLDITKGTIGVEAATALAKAIGRGSLAPLMHIKLHDNNIKQPALAALAPALAVGPKLEALELAHNPLRDDGAAELCQIIAQSTTLRVLDISDCQIGPQGIKTVCATITAQGTRLRQLLLAGNKLRAAGTVALCECLQKNTTINVLDLSANCVNSEGGRAVADLLSVNSTIDTLKAATNYFSDSVPHLAKALAERAERMNNASANASTATKGNTASKVTMRLLDISNNRIDTVSARRMAEVLEGKKFFASCISLERNPIGDEGIVGLYHAIKGTQIQFLDLSECNLTYRSGVVLADLIAACPLLNSLQIDGNELGDDAIHEIMGGLLTSTSLAAINLERTKMGNRGCEDLASAVAKRHGIRSVNIAENPTIERPSLLRLLEALANRNALEDLDLSDLPVVDEDESLLKALVALFPTNPSLNRILLERTPLAALLPAPGIMTRGVATMILQTTAKQQTADKSLSAAITASDSSIQKGANMSHASTNASIVSGVRGISTLKGSPTKGALVVADTTSRALVSGADGSTLSAAFRPPWALAVPIDSTPTPYLPNPQTPEDGRHPPLVPLPGSLHDTMYPGYGRGPISNSITLQSLNDPMPWRVRAAKNHKPPYIPTFDGSSVLSVPPKRPMKTAPYSLQALENNSCFLPVTEDQLRRKFAELDVDGSGFLDKKEFKALYLTFPNYGVPGNDKVVDALFTKYSGADGKLSFDEFSVLMLHMASR